MKILLAMLQKVGLGFLYGIGFGVAIGVIYYYCNEKMMDEAFGQIDRDKIVITKDEKIKRGTAVLILGNVENKSDDDARMLHIQVDLFDKNGKFVEQCSEYMNGALKAGESRNFKVNCGGCKDKPVAEHETYKVSVVGM